MAQTGRSLKSISPIGKKSVGGRYHFMRQKSSGGVEGMSHYNTKLPRSGRWTKEEDERLLSLTSEQGLLWTKFCQYFEYRTASDLLQRYTKLRSQVDLHTGLWSEFEKQKFDSLIAIHGRKFKTIALMMGTRTVDQCRARYSVISGKSTALSHLRVEQLSNLKAAIEKYGLDDFEQLVKEVVLPLNVSELDVRKYYRQELDPKIVRSPWTQGELDTMIQLFKELDGRMDLVQSMLPKKRSLKDMWVQYEEYCDLHLPTETS
ncbi:unnamed protein product [Mucor hiemalis]